MILPHHQRLALLIKWGDLAQGGLQKFLSIRDVDYKEKISKIDLFNPSVTSQGVDGNIGYFDIIHPAYTIFHQDTETFSSIWTEYSPIFSQLQKSTMAAFNRCPSTNNFNLSEKRCR